MHGREFPQEVAIRFLGRILIPLAAVASRRGQYGRILGASILHRILVHMGQVDELRSIHLAIQIYQEG